MRRGRIAVAVLLVWFTLLGLIACGELVGAIDTTLLTNTGPRLLSYDEAVKSSFFSDLVPRETLKRTVNWPRLMYLGFAPSILTFMVWWAFTWASRNSSDKAPLSASFDAGPQNMAWPRAMILILRILRGFLYVVAVWQVLTILPILSWFIAPGQITGGMIGQLFIKGMVFAACAVGSNLLRRLIIRLHVHYFGIEHPPLVGRFAL